jgi:hypothetical protein
VDAQSRPASQSPPSWGRSVPFPATEASPPQEGEGQGGGTRRGVAIPAKKKADLAAGGRDVLGLGSGLQAEEGELGLGAVEGMMG